MLPSHSQPLPTPHHTLSTFILLYLLCLPSVRVFILARSFLHKTSPDDVIALPDDRHVSRRRHRSSRPRPLFPRPRHLGRHSVVPPLSPSCATQVSIQLPSAFTHTSPHIKRVASDPLAVVSNLPLRRPPSSSAMSAPPPSSSIATDPLAELAQLRQQVAALNAFAAQTQRQSASSTTVPRVELPKIRQPSTFSGAMGFVVDDWVGEMEQQFSYYGAKFPDAGAQIRYAVAYLAGPAMHWWEHEPGRELLKNDALSWEAFVKLLHSRFRPVQAAMLARQRLGKLSQRAGQTVNQYTSAFQITMTPIVDMGDADQVHHYVNGLLGQIASKVWEKHPTDLRTAIDYAVSVEAMGNYGRAAAYVGHSFAGRGATSSASSSGVPMDTSLNNIEDHAGEQADEHVDPVSALVSKMESVLDSRLNALFGAARNPSSNGGSARRFGGPPISGLKPGEIGKLMSEGRCFRCKKTGHMKNECPLAPKSKNE